MNRTKPGTVFAVGGPTFMLLAFLMACTPITNPIQQDVAQKKNADLADLTASGGTLSPVFASDALSYSVTAGSGVESVTVTATKSATGAKIEARLNNGGWGELPSGSASSALALTVGTNLIELRVTAEDAKTTKTYSISVYRLSAAALLASLETSAGALDPAFDANSAVYWAVVANSTTSVTVTATVAHSGATLQVQANGEAWQVASSGSASPSLALDVGDNAVKVKVTAEDRQTTDTYTITVHRTSTDASLSALVPNNGTLVPGFSPNIQAYALTVGTSTLSLKPTAADSHAGIKAKANGGAWVVVDSGSYSSPLALSAGANTVEVLVTAEDGVATKTYSISAWRQSDNADLSSLAISQGSLSPAFAAATTGYSVTVANGVNSVSVTPTAAESHAVIQARMNGSGWQTLTSGTASAALGLYVGDNSLEVKVTAENGGTKSYVIGVHGISSSADLAALSLSSGILAPAFSSATLTYGTSVGNEVGSVLLTPSAATAVSNIQVRVNGGAWRTIVPGSASLGLALDVGDNSLEVKVVSENGLVTKVYSVMVHRISANAYLAGLVPSAGSLSPGFIAGTLAYSLTVQGASITVRPSSADTRAVIKVQVNGGGWQTVVSGNESTSLSLNIGTNAVVAELTAEDGITKRTYTISVYRQSDIADLSTLSLSAGSLSPAFTAATTAYTTSVPNSVPSVALSPIPADAHAVIQARVNGGTWQSVALGAASDPLGLNIGDNSVDVKLSSENGLVTKTYSIGLHRKSANADLSALVPSQGTLSPAFGAATTSYSASVASAVDAIAMTATSAYPLSTIHAQVNGGTWQPCTSGAPSPSLPLVVGDNTVTIRVTAEDGSPQKSHTIAVRRQGGVATLSALGVSAGTLSPSFGSGVCLYNSSLANASSSITVTATVTLAGATLQVKVNAGTWQDASSGSPSPSLPLNVGDNPVVVKVTSEDGSATNSYTVTVHRKSADANLSGLAVSTGTLNPSFSAATISYALALGNVTASMTVTPTAASSLALVEVQVNGASWQTMASGSASPSLTLDIGDNTVSVRVTAEDGSPQKTYTIAVRRKHGDANLSGLTISSGSLVPAFSAATTSYADTVLNAVASLTVTPTSSSSLAAIKVRVNSGGWQTVVSGNPSTALSLNLSPNTVEVQVSAEDMTITKTYSISVMRRYPGTLDSSFSMGSGSINSIYGTAIQSDGKILIGGDFYSIAGVSRGHVARLNSDGSLDSSFLSTGGGASNYILALALQGDGKILIGGNFTTYNGTARGGIARLNSDGSLDSTFMNGLAGTGSPVQGIAVQSDGKILVCGSFLSINGSQRYSIARLNSDGSIDSAFLPSGGGAYDSVYSVLPLSSGKILIVGVFGSYSYPTDTASGHVARLNSDGSIDTTFLATGAGLGANGNVYSMAVQSDGKILIGGAFTKYSGTTRGKIARLNADGSLDGTFLNTGVGADDFVTSILPQGSGLSLIGGAFSTYNGAIKGKLARLNNDGSLESTFLAPGTGPNNTVYSIVQQADGRFVIGGLFTTYSGTSKAYMARLWNE